MRINNFTKLLILIPIFSVYAQKGLTIDLNIKTEPIENGSINQTGIGVLFFKDIGTKNKLKNTFKYNSTTVTDEIETYLLKNYVTNYSNTHFNSFENIFELSHQITEKTKLNIAVEPTANYESNFEISDISILGGIELSQSLNKNNSIDVGIKRMTVFGKPEILPTFSFNHQFNNEAYLKLGFPNSELSYSNSIRNKFSLNNDFSGSSYNLNSPIITDDLNTITKVGFSQMETTLQFERNMDTSWYVSLKGGYSSNKEFKFSDENRTKEMNQTLKNGGIFSISIKYKL
ncbi:MAG TPA: DUF6268 family outer membrane beta-barrel protein [Flavobacterium sp.]|uniref:DUF6268 family outer membrane beta-barrel protein n=1 Tax=Flavobacterium sp. TaxID=239 RepID=UPI002DBAB100|nr:DUF6268 family outer membrane beta-barrel protein [Flavobacterium sp.]HEU4790847.1 DUF6268 family outer membrane beta-barrel protein [Flavobacterium sp.]